MRWDPLDRLNLVEMLNLVFDRIMSPNRRWRGIFQAGKPVLVRVDTASTCRYLLGLAEHRDPVTWSVRLLDFVNQGFDPEDTVADARSGLRAGQAQAPSVASG